jgi:hypothetical protein
MEPFIVNNYHQKAHEARQHMERSADPDVRGMWRNIAEHYEYLAKPVPQRLHPLRRM